MPIEIQWDEAQDASATISRNAGDRLVRVGLVSGLTAANTTSEKALGDALRAATTGIDTVYPHPDFTDAHLSYVTAQPHPQDRTKARIWAGYEPIAFSGSPVDRFAVEDVTNLVNDFTQFLPGTLAPLLATLERPLSSPNVPAVNSALTIGDPKTKVVNASYPRNYRALVLNGLFTSRPATSIYNATNCVNNANWQGRAAGYWKSEGPVVRWGSGQGLYQVRVPVLSRGDQPGDDWSTYQLMRHATGEYVSVDATLMAALLAQSYAFGPRNNHSGIYKAGLFHTANFGVIFDPLIDDTPLATSDGFANLVGR